MLTSSDGTPFQPLTWRHHLFVALVSLFFLLWFIPFYESLPGSSNSLDAPNEKTRVLHMMSIGLYGELHLNRARDKWHCRITDLSGRPRRKSDGPNAPALLLYPGKTPGMALTLGPLYGLYRRYLARGKPTLFEATYFARLVGTIIPTWLGTLLFYLMLVAWCRVRYVIWTGTLVFLLGTMMYPYALTVSSHSLANVMLLAAFAALIWCPRSIWKRFVASLLGGFCLGLSMGAEYSAVFTGLFLGFVGLWREPPAPTRYAGQPLPQGWRRALLWLTKRWHLLVMLIASCVPVGAVLWFHKQAFGAYGKTPYGHLMNPEFRKANAQGFMGFTFPPKLDILASSFFSPTYGMFFWSPFLLFAFVGMVYLWRKHEHLRFLVLCLLGLFLWWSFYHTVQFNPRGGWSVGPRYISNLVPFLMLMAVWGADQLVLRYGLRATPWVALTAAWSILFMTPISAYFPHIPNHSTKPHAEILATMLRDGLTPTNLFGISPGWATLIFFVALAGLLFTIVWGLQLGQRHRRPVLFVTLCLVLVCVVYLECVPVDHNYRLQRLDYIRALIPPAYRW